MQRRTTSGGFFSVFHITIVVITTNKSTMPSFSGTEFELIDQYLRIRDRIEEEDTYPILPDQKTGSEEDIRAIASDQKLPQFSASFLGFTDHEASPPLTMDGVQCGAPTPLGADPCLPNNFLLSAHDPYPSMQQMSPPSTSASTFPFSRFYVSGLTGSGGRVIETGIPPTTIAGPVTSSSSPVDVPYGEDPLSTPPDLYDMDSGDHKHVAFYNNNNNDGGSGGSTCSGSSSGVPSPYCGHMPEVTIKTEQMSGFGDFPAHCQMGSDDRVDLTAFMIKSLREDIAEESKQLNISLDPEKWSGWDTAQWVSSVLRKEQQGGSGAGPGDAAAAAAAAGDGGVCGSHDASSGHLAAPSSSSACAALPEMHVPGHTLCRLSLDDFQRLSPAHGALLHQRLELWRMAIDMSSEPMTQTVPQWYPHQSPVPHHPHPQHHHNPHPHHNNHHQHQQQQQQQQPHYHNLTPASLCGGSTGNIAHAVSDGTPNSMAIHDKHPNNHQQHHHQQQQHHSQHQHPNLYGTSAAPSSHLPLCISPAHSTDSDCSSLSASSLGGRGGVMSAGSHHSSAGMYGATTSSAPSTTTAARGLRLDDEVFESAAAVAVAAGSNRRASQLAPNPHRPHTHHHQHQHHHHLPTSTTTGTATTTTTNRNNVPTSTTTTATPRAPRAGKQTIHLWQFLRELLDNAESFDDCIKWTDRARGIFKIEDSSKVARLWGRRKNRPMMNYDKLSRSVRQYYKKGIIKKTEHSKRLVYQFCPAFL